MTRVLAPRLVLTDLRTGLPLMLGIMTTTAGLLLAVVLPDSSAGWTDALNAALVLLLYTGPLALAAAAAHTSSLGRKGLLDLASTTARGTWAPARLAATSSLAWAWAGLVLQTVVVLLKQHPSGGFAPASLLLPLSSVALTTAFSLLGSAVGSRLTGVLAAPLVTLAAFGGMFVTAASNSSHPALSPVFNGVWFQPNQQPNAALVGGQVLVSVALALLAAAALAPQGVRRVLAVVLGLASLVTGVGTLGRAGSSPVSYVRLTAPVCGARDDVSLCVWPQLQDRLEAQLEVLGRVTAALAPFAPVPRTFAQSGLELPGRTTIVVIADDDTELMTVRTVDAVLPRCGGDRRAGGSLKEWALVRLGVSPLDEESEVAEVLGSSEDRQRAWVSAQLEAMGC